MLTAKIISRHKSFSFLSQRQGRFGTIDGLRGFLAIAVFFHHFIITWYWKVNGIWDISSEAYYFENYGKDSVAIFFMITGFLFTSKIIKDDGNTNWFDLYKSRFFRIFPLYFFVLLIITWVVFSSSNFQLYVSLSELVQQYVKWIVFHGSAINDYLDTTKITAGVVWTLRYEWLFYMCLPILAMMALKFNRAGIFLLLLVTVLLFFHPIKLYSISTRFFIFFAIGGGGAYVYQRVKIPESFITNKLMSSLSLLVITFAILYPIGYDFVHLILVAVFFLLIAFGNDLFGIFHLKSSILLGEISYSIYMLHGVVLYLVFTVFNSVKIQHDILQNYLIFMPVISIAVVLVSAATFILIEKPSIKFGRKYMSSSILIKT